MSIVIRPYQSTACDRVADAARQGHRVIVLCSPTGSGKTTMACELIRRACAKDKRVLEIVHRRRLVDQFSERLIDFHLDHGIMMRGHRLERAAKVQVASRDTLLSRQNEMGFELPPADLVIVDEGRHAASPEFRKLLKPYEDAGAFIVLLDATPVLADGTGLGPWATSMVVAAKVTDLIRDGFLVPVKCYAPDRKRRGSRYVKGIAGDLVQSWKDYAENQPTVLFCSRVQHSIDAVEAFKHAGISAAHVDAKTPDDERDAIYDGLGTGAVQVVSNVGIIREGVDIPCLGCCQFYMNPPGRVAFLQGDGRIMRPFPGKKYGILIDHAGAIFQHGFPDEDTEWTLNGNVDADFAAKHDRGDTEKALYCKNCQMLYHGSAACPECGRLPQKPPRSIFAPPPEDVSNELLVETDRDFQPGGNREEKIQHWFRCLTTAKKKDGSLGMAAQIYKRKYREFPAEDFPLIPERYQWRAKVAEVFPDFGRKVAS